MSPDGVVDANPEAIIIGSPLDGTKNPDVVTMGTTLQDITGVVTFAFDFYRILPLTSAKVVAYPTELPSPTELKSLPIDDTGCQKITFGDYNVENLNPQSKHLPNVSHHIAHFLGSPDVLFLQEVQDNSGPTDDGVVSSDKTLSALAAGIVAAGGANYSWAVVDPVNNADGGEPGGNIRVAFLYRPEVVRLVNENVGTASNSTQVQNVTGQPELSLNPGRINPTSPVWTNSRKPVVCLFETIATKDRLFAINVHQSSKGGSSPIHGDPRTPVNGAIDARIGQAKETANFVSQILAVNPKAKIIISGDFNEFLFTKAVFAPFEGLVKDADVVVNIDPAERYTYQYDMSSQQLDHALVSSAIDGSLEFHHVHVNTWAPSYEARISDHDPTVGRLKMCKTQGGNGGNCSYKIESWCAAPLPSFHDFPSCL
ncbi:hypothetical protein FRC03_004465 [Tulasnella sp. 419]|nr:hypothetical protein FRC03_004465 [Tulasnella sp. 419]